MILIASHLFSTAFYIFQLTYSTVKFEFHFSDIFKMAGYCFLSLKVLL